MSLINLAPTVPCVTCKKNQVPLGKNGDNGKKKCTTCIRASKLKYYKKYHIQNYEPVEVVCIRCGRKYSEKYGVDICETCRMLAVDLFKNSQEQECIYCNKPSGTRKFCSHNCLVKTTKLAQKREQKINEMITD